MFDSLKGINPARDIQQRAESALEKLLKIEQEVHREYAGKVSDSWKENHDTIYLPMYQSLSQTLPDYTEPDLQSLLLAKANNNYPEHEAKVLGMYTGVLLHVLTERLEKEGKKAVCTFDLSGNQFDYLFFFAKRAGELMVKKVKGKRTCSYLASYGGTAEKVVLEGNEGDRAASDAGKFGGKVGTLLIHGNKGNWAASWAGWNEGKVGTLIIKDNKGDWAAFEAGSNKGNVGTLMVRDNEGHLAASWAGWNGGKVGTLALYKAGTNAGDGAEATRIITGEEALAFYKRLEKELPCSTI